MRSKKLFLSAVIIILLLLTSGTAYFYWTKKSAVLGTDITPTLNPQQKAQLTKKSQKPPPLNKRQKQELENQTSRSTKKKVFDIVAGNYFFSPNKITVNQGDNITIVFVNTIGMHTFIIDPFRVKTPVMQQGQFMVEKFTADKKGSYEFYSNLPQDKAMGMKGTLIVQ